MNAAKADAASLNVSTDAVSFGDVTVGAVANASVSLMNTGSVSLQVTQIQVAGQQFSVGKLALPVTLAPGSSYALALHFSPTVEGDASGQVIVDSGPVTATASSASTSAAGGTPGAPGSTATIKLTGKGAKNSSGTSTASLSGLTCSSGSVTGAGSDACTVSLSAAAGSGGLAVSLSSNNSAVTVPSSVTVPAGAVSAGFTASISAVSTAQTDTLTASAGGATQTYAISLGAAVPGLKLSAGSLSFGSVAVNSTATLTETLTSSGTSPLTISAASLTGAGFSTSGLGFPVTLNPGQTATLSVSFKPTSSGAVTGNLVLTDNASSGSASVSLSGTGQAGSGALSAVTCSQGSMTGSGSDACTVSLSAAAGSGGLAVSLSSNNSAVTVPSSVTVPAGAISAGFAVSVSAVSTAQTATVTASAGGVTKTYSISLGTAAPALTISTTTVSFGNVDLNSPATQQVTLTSSGTAALTVSAVNVSGTGFSISGISPPVTLNPGQSATLNVQFNPTVVGTDTGSVTLTSNAAGGGTAAISLSGIGQTVAYQVNLTWNAPTNSTDPVAGYNIYRAASGSSAYQLLNSSVTATADYTDGTVQNGTSYSYYVESVDASGTQSAPSNTFTVSIP